MSKSGTQPKFEAKLHCDKCGVKRLMSMGMPFLKEDGQMGVAFIKLKVLLKMLHDNSLPKQEGFQFPTKDLVAKCYTCNHTTFYDIVNNKLVPTC